MSAGVLHGRQRLFLLMATVGEGTCLVAVSSRRPLVRWFNTSALTSSLPPGQKGSDTGCSKESANVKCAEILQKLLLI